MNTSQGSSDTTGKLSSSASTQSKIFQPELFQLIQSRPQYSQDLVCPFWQEIWYFATLTVLFYKILPLLIMWFLSETILLKSEGSSAFHMVRRVGLYKNKSWMRGRNCSYIKKWKGWVVVFNYFSDFYHLLVCDVIKSSPCVGLIQKFFVRNHENLWNVSLGDQWWRYKSQFEAPNLLEQPQILVNLVPLIETYPETPLLGIFNVDPSWIFWFFNSEMRIHSNIFDSEASANMFLCPC